MLTYRTAVRQAIEQLRQSEVLAAERVASEVGDRLQARGHTIHAWARQSDPADEIQASIDTERPDLVVLGLRGRVARAAPPGQRLAPGQGPRRRGPCSSHEGP